MIVRTPDRNRTTIDWRESLMAASGPGILAGVTFGDWLKLLWHNRFRVSLDRLPRASSITFYSFQNSFVRWIERWRFSRCLQDVQVQPPVFIIGHWRSGTTHLHNL